MSDLIETIQKIETLFLEREPSVLAFLPEDKRFQRLRREAQKLLEKYPEPDKRPPLFGELIGVKDIFHVSGFTTRAGSRLPTDLIQGEQAESVTKLIKAGALILGKTVTTEFAYFAPGPTRNPHNADHTPGGSSSGSAAAVGAELCRMALGTQTIGSITRPAAFCGVVGYKPSYDRISRSGVIPLSPSLDHIGGFTRTVATAEKMASLSCQSWTSLEAPLRKPTLGIPEGPYLEHASGEGLTHFREVCHLLSQTGFELVSVSAFKDFDAIASRHNLIVAAEAARVHARWFSQFESLYHLKTAELIRRGQGFSNAELEKARQGREKLRNELLALMDEHSLDLWICPSAPGPAPKGLDSTGNPVMNLPWTHAGLPTLNLPSGLNGEGLPMGLQVSGRWYEDEKLFTWGKVLEATLAYHNP